MTPLCLPRTSARFTLTYRRLFSVLAACVLALSLTAAEPIKRTFDLPAADAERSLKLFSAQSGLEVVFPAEITRGVRTREVKGELTAREAMHRMLDGTGLIVTQDEISGAFSIARGRGRNVPRAAQATESGRPSQSPISAPDDAAVERQNAVPANQRASSQIVELEVFTVDARRDTGFVAASSLAGGRLASDLAETPVAYSVQTREFLEALNLTDLIEAQQWAPNVVKVDNDEGDYMFGGTGQYTVRGVTANPQQKNFYSAAPGLQGGVNFDTYNIERLDYSRGPNSILFGTGGVGGTSNAVPKFARIGQRTTQVRLETGSGNHKRATLDYNQPLTKKVAVRLNTMWQDSESWRDHEYIKKRGISPAITIDFNRDTRLSLTAEYTDSKGQKPHNYFLDFVSAWDGVTTFDARHTGVVNPNWGVGRHGANTLVYAPGSGRNDVINWEGYIVTNGGQTVFGGNPLPAGFSAVLHGNEPITNVINQPPGLYDTAINGTNGNFYLPDPAHHPFWDDVGNKQWFRNLSLNFDRRLTEHLLLQVAGDYVSRDIWGNIGEWDRGADVRIDLNRNLPTGESNPNFLQPFLETAGTGLVQSLASVKSKAARASLAYVRNFKWVGLRLNAMAGYETSEIRSFQKVYVLPFAEDPRIWGANLSQSRAIRYRLYWNEPSRPMNDLGPVNVISPATGTTVSMQPLWVTNLRQPNNQLRTSESKYFQVTSNLSFFEKRLIVLGAIRRDDLGKELRTSLAPMDYPADYGPIMDNPIWRPEAPADYYTLTYRVKNAQGVPSGSPIAATSRPRSDGVRAPQYASDRFQDDFSPPDREFLSTTYSAGGIFNVTKWFGVWGNYAETFNPFETDRLNLDFSQPSPIVSEGIDFGIRLNLGKGRAIVNVSRYETKQMKAGFNAGTANRFNIIIGANAVGDETLDGANIRGVPFVPEPDFIVTRDYEVSGYEFEVVANLTPAWRLTANLALSDAFQANSYQEVKDYWAANKATLRTIMEDAGVTISATDQATVNPNASVDASAAAGAWNILVNNYFSNIGTTSGRQQVRRSNDYTANVYTDYLFMSGKLEGLRLGFGMQFRGPQVIGYHGADTIIDPSNPNATIDDPTKDALTPLKTEAWRVATLTIRYPLKVFDRKIDLNLSVSNLFNNQDPIYVSERPRAPGGDLTSPVRVTVPSAFGLRAPRGFKLSATYQF